MPFEVSVVIPAYNRSSVLCYAIESVLAQTTPVAEVIVVNDGSTDDTERVILGQIRDNPRWRRRVRYLYQHNQGQSAAINYGVAESQGDWLGFVAQDDLWLPNKVEWQFRALAKYGSHCRICFTDAWFMNNPHMKHTVFQSGTLTSRRTIDVLKNPAMLIAEGKNSIWMQTVLASRSVLDEVQGHDPLLRYSEDLDILFRMSLRTGFCFVNMPLALIDRSPAERRHSGEGRNWHKEEYCLSMEQRRFETQLRHLPDVAPETRRLIQRNLAHLHSSWASWAIANHDYHAAKASVRRALKYRFSLKLALKAGLIHTVPNMVNRWVAYDRAQFVRADRVSWQTDDASETL